jgi:hypothetical protein
MASREPDEPATPKSEFIAFLQWVLSARERVRRLQLLISTVLINVVLLAAVGVTVIFYLKVDPKRWGAVAGLAVVVMTVAKAVSSTRAWFARRRASLPADDVPAIEPGAARADGESGRAGDGEGDDEVGQ